MYILSYYITCVQARAGFESFVGCVCENTAKVTRLVSENKIFFTKNPR